MRTYPDLVERLRAPIVDGYAGARLPDWSAATSTSLRVSVQPVSTTEDTDSRQTTVQRWQLRAPSAADLVSSDRIRWRGLVLEVDGDVEVWDPTRPRRGHLACLLRLAVDGD